MSVFSGRGFLRRENILAEVLGVTLTLAQNPFFYKDQEHVRIALFEPEVFA